MSSTSIFHPESGTGTVQEHCAAIITQVKQEQKKTKSRKQSHKRSVSHDKRGTTKVQCKFCEKSMNLNYLKNHVMNSCPDKPHDFDDNLKREDFIKDDSNESLSNSSNSAKSESISDEDLYDNEPDSHKRSKPNYE